MGGAVTGWLSERVGIQCLISFNVWYHLECCMHVFHGMVLGEITILTEKTENLKTRVRGWEISEMAHGDWLNPQNGVQSAD